MLFRENKTPARHHVSLSFDFHRKSDAAPSWWLKQPQGQCGEGGLAGALWPSCLKRTMGQLADRRLAPMTTPIALTRVGAVMGHENQS